MVVQTPFRAPGRSRPEPLSPAHESGGAPEAGEVSARMLLQSRELAEVAARQIIDSSHGLLDSVDEGMVHAAVAGGLRNISLILPQRSPEVSRQLDSFQITRDQKEALLGVVGHMSDRRVQNVGLELAEVVWEFLSVSRDREGMKQHIMKRMRPRLAELRKLRDEVYPAVLRRASAAGKPFGVDLDPDQLRVVRNLDRWHMELDVSRPTATRRLLGAVGPEEKRIGVFGGLREETRVVLDQLHSLMQAFRVKIHEPEWISSLLEEDNVLGELIRCVTGGGDEARRLMMCPMKLASAGMDVMSSMGNDRGGSMVDGSLV